ncbi:hypothetical protein BDFB_005266 [Asbolus verrucosus]|uniref:Uncharacterized protein n=1 Tax=Asbolus verrucosus TaxID=1661398 RepID=A0A482VDX4_ASBVE|nr:hypothetical protein BDFB_005266 [Asbolus verrucosus]
MRGRRPGAVPPVRLPVLRGERGGELRGGFPRLPVAPPRGQVGAAAESSADPAEAGREQCFQGFRQHIRQELQRGPQEETLA